MENLEISLDSAKRDNEPKGSSPNKDIPEKIQEDQPKRAESTMDKLDIRRSAHPLVCLFHISFKLLAILFYFINDVVTFIIVTLLSCVDFWIVKNVSGRLLVGLRWWTTVDDEGNEKWFFESYDQKVKNNPIDHRIFWWGQMGVTGIWTVFLVWRILTIFQLGFFWTALSFVGFFFTSTNLYAFFKCSKDHRKKLKGMMTNVSSKIVTTTLMSKYGMGLFK